MTRARSAAALIVVLAVTAARAGAADLPGLRVAADHRTLETTGGEPFFYLADTAWEIFHRLDRDQAARYLQKRADQRFTAIQAVALAEFDGLSVPNAQGDLPLIDGDPARPATTPGANPASPDEYDYWDHVDYIVAEAAARGLRIAMLPTWGRWVNDRAFDATKARSYGEFLGNRYAKAPIIWVLGGDRLAEGFEPVWRAMAAGIAIGVSGREDYGAVLMTFHPRGGRTSSTNFHDDPWLDFNMQQTGHGAAAEVRCWERIAKDYQRTPNKPVIDGEPLYEDHPIGFNSAKNGYSFDAHIRQRAYWDLFAGATGHTYGNHSIWQMNSPRLPAVNGPLQDWDVAIDRPGATQMRYVRALIESRPVRPRIPDDSIVVDPLEGADRINATRGEGYAFIYSAQGRKFVANLGKVSGDAAVAWWFNPRDGTARPAGRFPNQGTHEFKPPSEGFGSDWILVLDDAGRTFPPPGTARP